MSDANPHTIPHDVQEIPGPTRFAVRGQGFNLDVLDTIYLFHDQAEEVRAAGGTHRQYLDRVIDHVQGACGVTLTYGEADWLNDHLETALALEKKTRRERIAAALTSRSSTASTPAD